MHQSSIIGTPPHSQCVPPLVPGDTLACERGGGGGPNSDEGTDTVVLKVYAYFESENVRLNYVYE